MKRNKINQMILQKKLTGTKGGAQKQHKNWENIPDKKHETIQN